jgi:hypothetical protein
MSSTHDDREDETSQDRLPYQVRVDQGHLMAAVVMLVMSIVAIAYAPSVLFWLPVLPLLFIVWILRCRTTFYDKGITARYLFRKSASLAWEDFDALRFTRGGKALAVRTDGTSFPLPGVSFNSLIDLSGATEGRIPDPVTPSLTAIDESVKVVNRDGYAVLMDKDEYVEYEAARRTGQMAREELERRDEARRKNDSGSPEDNDPQGR